ncbi:MAG: hypothetical protein FWG70_12065 [Oscillospiraceae bacterium]|nr:hypothetical protein [Oscillospiraceae bacterium]
MDKEIRTEYKAVFSQVRSACRNKTEVIMNLNNTKKQTIKLSRRPIVAVAAIALVIALSVAGYAIVMNLRSPGDIARDEGMNKLAEAFDNGSGLEIQESVVSNGYVLSLHGLAIGSDLNEYRDFTEINSEETYAIISIAKESGAKMQYSDPEFALPLRFHSNILFEGFKPWQFNSVFFGLGGSVFEKDGVMYMIYSVGENVEIFADKAVYLAIWDDSEAGVYPSSELFEISDDGKISFVSGLTSAHALFTLPLDSSKADPAKVEKLLDELGVYAEFEGDDENDDVLDEPEVIIIVEGELEGESRPQPFVFVEEFGAGEFGEYHVIYEGETGGGAWFED